MWERLRRFSALPKSARMVFLRAAVLLPWVAARLKVSGFQATKNALLRRTVKQFPPDDSRNFHESVELTAKMVRAASRHGVGSPSCLEESLVLLHMLAKQGISAQLRIGVKRNQPKFEAHAWVECGGIALNESDALHDHFTPFETEFPNLPPEKS